jgi:site-specific recombinase
MDAALAAFPEAERKNRRTKELCTLLGRLCAARDLRGCLDELERLARFVIKADAKMPLPVGADATGGAAAHRRLLALVGLLEACPPVRAAAADVLGAIVGETRALGLFADAGLPDDRGIYQETTERVFRRVLPSPRDEQDLGRLLVRVFPGAQELAWLEDLPPDLFERLAAVVSTGDGPGPFAGLLPAVGDALALLAARVQALGLSNEMRARSRSGGLRESPFFRLPREADRFLALLDDPGPRVEAERALRLTADGCREEMRSVVERLESTGISINVVYGLEVIEQALGRMERLVEVLATAPGPERADSARRLLGVLVRARQADRSLRDLARANLHLLARKLIERAGHTGEHYITATRREYFRMFGSAAGGGVLTVGTAGLKLTIAAQHFPLFVEGFVSGINYALSFILIQFLGFTLATKQPSMTAASLAGTIRDSDGPERFDALVTKIARICRSQLAAAGGNILLVALATLAFDAFWVARSGHHFIGEEKAARVLTSFHPGGSGTIFYAILTGVILWFSSLAGGWIENFAVYHRLPQAIAEHRLGRVVGERTMGAVSRFFARNVSGYGGSIALGFMLGMTPVLGQFFGLPLDVRHVTLSTGQLAFAAVTLGAEGLRQPAFAWAVAGIAVIFVLNLSTSFLLALGVAFRAREVPTADRLQLARAVLRRLLRSPGEFVFPPRTDGAEVVAPAHH